jgi:hypothetical protein
MLPEGNSIATLAISRVIFCCMGKHTYSLSGSFTMAHRCGMSRNSNVPDHCPTCPSAVAMTGTPKPMFVMLNSTVMPWL